MDLVTQGILGATFAQSFSKKHTLKVATIAGFLSGLGADADGFIRSSSDPLLTIEFHRHFTHSLIFIPVGALITAFIAWVLIRRTENFKVVYLYSLLGYATHGVLDACTSYGTQLFWPFSNERIAWDNIAIIDPFFSLPLLFAMIWVLISKNVRIAQIALAVCIGYLAFGVFQRDRAISFIKVKAESRGHAPITVQAKPTFGQLILFKTIYTEINPSGEKLYFVDAVRLGIPGIFKTVFYDGESAPALDVEKEFANLKGTTLYRDIQRFTHFSSNVVIMHPDYENVIGDARYSFSPNSLSPIWGISVDVTKPNEHVKFLTFRSAEKRDFGTLWSMIKGTYKKDLISSESRF